MRINLKDKTKVVCLRLSDDQVDNINKLRDGTFYTVSDIIRIALDDFFLKHLGISALGKTNGV